MSSVKAHTCRERCGEIVLRWCRTLRGARKVIKKARHCLSEGGCVYLEQKNARTVIYNLQFDGQIIVNNFEASEFMACASFYSLGGEHSATGAHPSSFDYQRIVQSVLIIAVHSCLTSWGLTANDTSYAGDLRRFCARTISQRLDELFRCIFAGGGILALCGAPHQQAAIGIETSGNSILGLSHQAQPRAPGTGHARGPRQTTELAPSAVGAANAHRPSRGGAGDTI